MRDLMVAMVKKWVKNWACCTHFGWDSDLFQLVKKILGW
jgi:hypothetical protein